MRSQGTLIRVAVLTTAMLRGLVSDDEPHHRWTVPIGGGVGRVFKIVANQERSL